MFAMVVFSEKSKKIRFQKKGSGILLSPLRPSAAPKGEKHMKRAGNQRGFTLIEAMIVVLITAIMAGIGIPAFMSYRPRIQLSGAARQVMTQLLLSRMEAVKNVCNVSYTFASTGTGITKWVDKDRDGAQDSDEVTVLDMADYFEAVAKAYSDPIQFNSRGAAPVNGKIALENSAGQRIITVNLAGHVRISDLIVPTP